LQRDADDEFRAIFDIAGRDAAVHVVFDDHFGHVETDAAASVPGREIRVEYSATNLFRKAATVVMETI
jgi:hypothetical protein